MTKIKNAQAQPAPHRVSIAAMIAMIFVLVFNEFHSKGKYFSARHINTHDP
jgi:hypothetical protein